MLIQGQGGSFSYALYNVTIELGARIARAVFISGDMPTLNYFGCLIQKGQEIDFASYDLLYGVRSNFIKDTKLGLFAYSPFYHYNKIQSSDTYGGLLEVQRALPYGLTGLLYLGYIPEEKPFFDDSIILKIGAIKRIR